MSVGDPTTALTEEGLRQEALRQLKKKRGRKPVSLHEIAREVDRLRR